MDLLTIIQKLLKTYSAASDHEASRVSVMQWSLEVIIYTVQHNECSYSFWDQQEVSRN